MSKYITKFNRVGESVLDVELVCQDWNEFDDAWFISVVHFIMSGPEFTFHTGEIKTRISAEQANYIIAEVGLCRIDSTVFNSGATYRSPNFIASELDRLSDLKIAMEFELTEIRHAIYIYENATS
jgi:hypothetical protein